MNALIEQEVEPFHREKWLAERRKEIGASEVSSILGLNPYGTAWEVAADKRGLLNPFENKATGAGKVLEVAVLDHAESVLGTLKRNVRIKHKSLPLAATCDAQIAFTSEPVEAKTTGIVGPIVGQWGDALTDQVPDYYLVQVHAQLMCTGKELGYLFALLPGRGFVEYHIEANPTLHEYIGNVCADWWEKYIVQGHDVPMTVKPALEVVKRLRKTPNKVIEADAEFEILLGKREADKAMIKEYSEHLEQIEAELLVKLGDAEAANLSDGRQFTHLESSRKGYTVEPCKFRQIRIKKGK